jgi:hypothetical protein
MKNKVQYNEGERMMVYEVDFSIKVDNVFRTIYKAFIYADSVSECQHEAELIRDSLARHKNNKIHIFIEA